MPEFRPVGGRARAPPDAWDSSDVFQVACVPGITEGDMTIRFVDTRGMSRAAPPRRELQAQGVDGRPGHPSARLLRAALRADARAMPPLSQHGSVHRVPPTGGLSLSPWLLASLAVAVVGFASVVGDTCLWALVLIGLAATAAVGARQSHRLVWDGHTLVLRTPASLSRRDSPLWFCAQPGIMGSLVNTWATTIVAGLVAAVIVILPYLTFTGS